MIKVITAFYKQIYNLACIKRYSVVPRIKDESIAEHSFFVSSIVVKLHEIYEFDLGTALTMATVHDWTESYTDDITTLTKNAYPQIRAAVEEVENIIAKKEFSPEVYALWFRYKEQHCIESRIVKLADTIQVMQYAANEIALGNKTYMASVHQDATFRMFELEGELREYKKAN